MSRFGAAAICLILLAGCAENGSKPPPSAPPENTPLKGHEAVNQALTLCQFQSIQLYCP